MEDVAIQSNNLGNIKFLEGLTIAVESFGGEILFFAYSGIVISNTFVVQYVKTTLVGFLDFEAKKLEPCDISENS